ncbi:MAG: TIGR02281 family clan AA aspartic protease [Cycloclasticus sp.]|mgnify:CR=1 FL=1|jgi:aspartyl protease family protein|nr:MAG: aspartyl protease [Cycloclasticus sp. Phe_18]MDF1689395.1 TIGR02281 family clan AA aspartic protease [Cycloclasticus sp.]MEE4291358.1 TIGR02281 family clan AA aspartic protease [Cycloclasticus sp.]
MKSIEPNNKISKVMVSLAWIGLLAMLAIGFDRYFEQQSNPNKDPVASYTANGSAEVTLMQNRQGHYIADGKLNDHWATFVLDTGATNVSIPAKVAEEMNLTEGHPERTRTANGDIIVYRVILDSVALGSIKLNNVAAHINPHMDGKAVLLGMSFLKHIEMSQVNKQLTLRLKPR